MLQSELLALIEHTAPLHLAAPWDHSGLQVAAARERVTRLAVCLDPLPCSVRAALDSGADMLLSHHPLSMESRFLDRLDNHHETVRLLLGAGVALYAAHTSLDVNPAGPVAWLADEFGLDARKVLEPVPGADGFGFGLCGDLPETLAPADVFARLKPWVDGHAVTLAGPDLPGGLRRIAICPGSGSSMADQAASLGAQAMITGDVKYHSALECPIPLLDVGHFVLEEEMMRRFAALLSAHLPVTFIPGRDPLRPADV